MRVYGRVLLLAFIACIAALGPVAAQQASLVRVDAVRSEPLTQTVPVIGRLVAQRTGEVATRIGGSIVRFAVEVGDHVEEGQAIAELDTALLEAQLALAEGELRQAQADLAASQAALQLAEQERDRFGALEGTQAFSKARYEDAIQNVARARADISKAEALITTRRASVDLNRLNLEYAVIRAPYEGVILRRMAETGGYVTTGDALVSMMSDTSLEVEADVPSQRIAGLVPGTGVTIHLEDGSSHAAIVRAALPLENPLTRTRTVRFVPQFGADVGGLADAQSVTIDVPVGARRDILSVHKDAIIQRGGQPVVYVVEDDVAQQRVVELGDAVGGRVEVLNGLAEGDQVVVRGNERLSPGAAVRIDAGS